MLRTLKISGFKNFRGKSVELKELKRINLLVGINGSGKSSVLELLALSSRFDMVTSGIIPVQGNNFIELNSLFGAQTSVEMIFDSVNFSFIIKTGRRNAGWNFEKTGAPEGSMEVVAVWKSLPFSNDEEPSGERPFSRIREVNINEVEVQDLEAAQDFLKSVKDDQRLFTTGYLRGEDFYQEDQNEIWPQRLAGGNQYLGMLIRAIRVMPTSNRPASIILIDDLGDSIFPALRKAVIPKLNEELQKHPENQRSQMFAATHNIEIVKSALENPDYCSVYMFDYDGSLVEFDDSKVKKTETSSGLKSTQEIPIIARMLGLTDLDLGFPEMIILTEEETKRTFLNALQENPNIKDQLRKFDVLVPFQQGDGNVPKIINNLLDLSKYFSFSDIWSDRYIMLTDFNPEYYDEAGNVKDGDNQHMKALKKAQEKLGLNKNFLLTKKEGQFVSTIEETYPNEIWESFKAEKSISEVVIIDWIRPKKGSEKGKAKNDLAKFVGTNITLDTFRKSYPELSILILK